MKLEDTGIRITEEEGNALTQSMGLGKTLQSTSMVIVHNMLLKLLAEKYKYDWQNVEINPLECKVFRKVIEADCENCDEKISKEDISIKE